MLTAEKIHIMLQDIALGASDGIVFSVLKLLWWWTHFQIRKHMCACAFKPARSTICLYRTAITLPTLQHCMMSLLRRQADQLSDALTRMLMTRRPLVPIFNVANSFSETLITSVTACRCRLACLPVAAIPGTHFSIENWQPGRKPHNTSCPA